MEELKAQWLLYKEALAQARQFEQLAEQYRLEAENAYADVAAMKKEGQRRAAAQNPRMLPQAQRATDVRTNSFKAMADAKGDVAFYMNLASTYANLATMKYSKAAANRPR